MPNQVQPRPQDSIDEKTIEENIKEMEYDPKEDIMRQNIEVDADLGTTDKQVSSADKLAKGNNFSDQA